MLVGSLLYIIIIQLRVFFEAWIDVLYILCSIQVLEIIPMFLQLAVCKKKNFRIHLVFI